MNKPLAIAQVVWLDWMRRKDIYVFLALLCGLLVALTTVDMFGLHGTVRYALDMGLLLVWISGWLLALNAGSRELPQEESRGTVYLLLAKPVRRIDLVLGKWLGAWSAVCAAVTVYYLATWAVVTGQGVHVDAVVLLQAWLLHLSGLGVMTALALLLGTRLNRDAAATLAGVSALAALILVPRMPLLLGQGGPTWRTSAMQALYYVLPHLELFDLRRRVVHELGPVDAGTLLLVLAYGVVQIAIVLIAAWLAYRGKRFVRGQLTE